MNQQPFRKHPGHQQPAPDQRLAIAVWVALAALAWMVAACWWWL